MLVQYSEPLSMFDRSALLVHNAAAVYAASVHNAVLLGLTPTDFSEDALLHIPAGAVADENNVTTGAQRW